MFYSEVSSLLLVSLSHIFLLPISVSPETIQDPSTASTWHCYKEEFAQASPSGHSLQAPCLRFIPTSPAKVIADGTEVHPVRVQVAPGLVSEANIQLSWTLIVSATQQGGRSESYPVQQCRNKISCDIHLPTSVFSHGKPIVMVTGSYQRTPWLKTILNISLQEQDKSEALLLVPRQPRQYQASQQLITQQPSQKTPHQSGKHKGRPSDLHSNTQWLERIGPRNSLKDLGTQVQQVSTVRRVRRGRNNPPSQQDVRTSMTSRAAFRRTGQTPKGRFSVDTLPQGGENAFRLQNHSRRKNRGRPSENVRSSSRKTRLKRQKQLSSRSGNVQETHNEAVSRPVGGLLLSQRQSSRHLPQRRDNRQFRRARAFGYQSPGQESQGSLRRYAVPGTRQRNRKKSADVRSYQTGIQPLQSWQRPSEQSVSSYPLKGHSAYPGQYPIQNPPPWTQQNYRQRIKSEFHALQNLQSNLHHRGKRVHRRHTKKKKQKEKGLHNVGLLHELQDLRADYLTRLNLLSPGESLLHRSSPPRQKHKELTKTPKSFTKIAKKPQRIIPNYYPIIPPRRVKQERVTTVPTVAAVMTTTVKTTTAAPAANLTTKAGMTTFGSSPIGGRPIGGRPMSNLERMRNDRMMYQGLGRNYQQGDPNNARTAVNRRWRDSSASGRVWNTFTEDRTIPRRPELETGPSGSGSKNDKGLSGQASVDILEGAEDGETGFRGTFPKTSQYEDYPLGFGQKTEDSGNRLGIVSSDPQSNEEQKSKTPRRDDSQDDAKELNRQDTWTEYSGLLPADYDEIEEDAFKDTGGTEYIYDNGVSVDTWGELKSNLTKPVRSIVDLLNRRMSMDDDSMPKPITPDKYTRELDMPFNEQTFRALQEEIINEERKEPEDQGGSVTRHSAEKSYLGHNILQQKKYSASPPRPSAFGSNAGKQSAPVRSSRTVNKDFAFETSASEPMEYSYNPSSDLSELGTAVSDAMQDTDGRALDEETFLATREKILQEERVGPGQRANGGQSTHGLSRKVSGREEIRNRPQGNRDHIGSITVTNRKDALLSNDQTGWEMQQVVDINHQDSIPQDLGPIENSAAETTEDRPSALQAGLNPGFVVTKETEEDYFGYYPVSEEDKERLESQSDEWSEWSQCSHSCGHGTKTRHRACTGPDTSNCVSGVESHAVQCALQRCSEDWEGVAEMTEEPLSQWRDWSGWSVCSVSCGRGLSRRERTCLDQELSCTGQKTETRACQLEDCSNDWNGAKSEGGTARRSYHGHHHHSHHSKRIKCHLDENRSQLPMELYWTSPSGEKITHAMTHEKNSKYHIEGTTLVVHEDKPTEGSYHCVVIYGGSSGSHNKEKAGPTGACLSHPCHHKGVCLDQSGPNNVSYRCLCPAGYEGMTCHMAPYLKGDVVVLSLLGWFVVSSTVIILILCFCCSKQMKKKKMKQRLELDDAPAEKLLAKILPHIDTTHKIESDTEEDIKPLLDFRPPQVTTKPPLKSTLSKEPVEMTRQPGKVRFKNLVKKVSTTPKKKVEGTVAFPTLKQIKSLTEEFKAQRNQNNSNKLDSNESDDDSLSSYTTLSSSCGSIPEEDNGEECEQMVNQNMNNCSWDYSNVSSCAPFDLNSSSIVGNDDDSLLEISTEDFRDFQVASAFSVFRGSPSLNGKQAVISPSLVNENSNAIPACSPSLPSEVPRGSEKHPMYHFDPTDHHSTYMSSSTIERLNYSDIGLGSASGTRPWRSERPWSLRTPTQRGNGVRVRLPPSPPLSVSPSRLPLPPSPMGQGEPRMFGQAEERAILEQYREHRSTHPRNAKSDMSFSMSPQDAQLAATSAAGMELGLPQERRQSSP